MRRKISAVANGGQCVNRAQTRGTRTSIGVSENEMQLRKHICDF